MVSVLFSELVSLIKYNPFAKFAILMLWLFSAALKFNCCFKINFPAASTTSAFIIVFLVTPTLMVNLPLVGFGKIEYSPAFTISLIPKQAETDKVTMLVFVQLVVAVPVTL